MFRKFELPPDLMWIKKRFFDKRDKDILAITRNYYHNEFLSPTDLKMFESLKERDFESYKIADI